MVVYSAPIMYYALVVRLRCKHYFWYFQWNWISKNEMRMKEETTTEAND